MLEQMPGRLAELLRLGLRARKKERHWQPAANQVARNFRQIA